jgi:hypothetical protein
MGLLAVVLAASLFVGTLAVAAMGHDNAFATSKKHIKKNSLDQAIAQPQSSSQNSQCVSGLLSLVDCNNVAAQLGLNLGNLAGAQQ